MNKLKVLYGNIRMNSDIYNIISSGSEGNCEIAFKYVMIDCGVSFKKIKPYLKDIKIIFLSHKHSDHFNLRTIQKIQQERPTVRVACGIWMLESLIGVNNIDILELNKIYDYKTFKVSIGKLYHDTKNSFFRLFFGDYKIFRATDTAHLKGITAKGYDLYAIEHNYCEEYIQQAIEEAHAKGEYTHAYGNINTHLSIQQARAFIEANRKESSEVLELHKSKSFYK